MSLAKLTDKQMRFIDEYLIDLNATRAYKTAYPNVKSDEAAASAAVRLLRNVKVQVYLKERQEKLQKRTEITQDRVLMELAKIAFASGADFAKVVTEKSKSNPDVEFQRVEIKDTESLPDGIRSAISNIKETKYGISVESYDKVKALELLGRHLGMFKDKVELSGEVTANNPMAGLTTAELKKLIDSG